MLIDLRKVEKAYRTGTVEFKALKGIDFEAKRGEYIAVVGPSGSGKSTLMNIVGCLDVPTAGEYLLEGQPVNKMTSNQLADVHASLPSGSVIQRLGTRKAGHRAG